MEGKFTILMFPWLAHGHIYPFLELSKRLTTRNFHICFCSTPINLGSIKAEASSSSIELVELHVPSSPELPPHWHTTKNLPLHLIPNLIQAFQDSSPSFVEILDAKKPDLVIYDVFQPWAPKLASSKGIPAVFLGISGSASIAYYHHMHTPGNRRTFPSETVYLLDHEKYDVKSFIIRNLKDADLDDPGFGHVSRSTEIILMKSCRVVEGKYGDYLSSLCEKEVVTTGPLVADYGSDSHHHDEDEEILKWLSGKDPCSTLYISFGSQHYLSERVSQEIAKGLASCSDDVNFIWAIRFPPNSSVEQVLPQTFLDKTKDRGRIITGWAPQQKILAHPSVGGFISHCGTNAITEAMYYSVPVLAMPVNFEQPLTARLSIEAGFATEVVGKAAVNEGLYNYLGEDIVKAIDKVFTEKESGEGLRKRAKELSREIKEDEEDEVSYVAERLSKLCIKYKQRGGY